MFGNLEGCLFEGRILASWPVRTWQLFIYATFLGQREQMAQQQAELESQRKQFEAERADQQQQIEAQKQQFQEQQESIKRQNFENSLFKLLDLHIQNATMMRNRTVNPGTKDFYTYEGRVCFLTWYNELTSHWNARKKTLREEEMNSPRVVNEFFSTFYAQKSAHLAHYFRTLYHAFKFIAESDTDDKRRYTSLIRAQLSSAELLLLFYNCLGAQGEKFKPIIEKYGLFEHLDVAHLLEPVHKGLYQSTAYQ